MLLIRHAHLVSPDSEVEDASVLIKDGIIESVGVAGSFHAPDAKVFDASDLILTPGFIDLQVNGAFGHDFTADSSTIWEVASGLPQYGVTAFLPTIITSPLDNIAGGQEVMLQGPPSGWRGAEPLGLHVEGPFLNPQKKGAHNPAYLRSPDLGAIEAWSRENSVRLVTLAPELPGALPMVEALVERGVLVSAGHSMATYDEARVGFDAGIRYGTHLFNAMPSLSHREPALPGALLTDDRPTVGFIADGIHTHTAVMALAWKALGSRMNVVTDAMAALGMPPGQHILGDFQVNVDGESARLADGTLAGCVMPLDAMLRNLITYAGCTLQQALTAITDTPARALGIEAERGRIAPRARADLVLLNQSLQVHTTLIGGEIVFSR
ncbi:MAG: N-acetylglucosamine-6-phosphate deacetylase [Caldilineales bacterium]|nr:N-acetylglucosamine-6-phosphate deacetylase [Caldilineales bacterium]